MSVSGFERKLIDLYQRNFPLCEEPYLKMAEELNASEEEVLQGLTQLKNKDILSRVGPVFAPNRVGQSCLAALKIEPEYLETVANKVSDLKSVNHNYEREHEYNLWFVVTAKDKAELDKEIIHIENLTGLEVLVLPLEREFFIDLGFDIPWGTNE